jgi:hypothetical protein
MILPRDLTDAITETVEALIADDDLDDVDSRERVNDGHCNTLAADVLDALGHPPSLRRLFVSDGHQSHYWLSIYNRHYDAERPFGVDDWKDLPFFTRHPHLTHSGPPEDKTVAPVGTPALLDTRPDDETN